MIYQKLRAYNAFMWLIAALLIAFKAFHPEGFERLLWSVSSATYFLFALGQTRVLVKRRRLVKRRTKP